MSISGDPGPAGSLVGQQLGRYRLEAFLGAGGSGWVYRARCAQTGELAAVKVMFPALQLDPDAQERFERETQALARLGHPHIVRLYQFGQAGERRYMAVQFIDGPDLESYLHGLRQRGAFLDYAEAARLLDELAQALDYIHSLGLVHRDVKTRNVLLDRDSRAYLCDFGLVLLRQAGTRGEVLGTPHYLAPEQAIFSAHATPLSDLYSLGVIAYEMLTGRLPFDHPDPLEVALQQISLDPPSPRSLRPRLPERLESVLLRALCKQPAGRYPSGAAFAAEVRSALGFKG